MNNKVIVAAIIGVVVLGGGYFLLSSPKSPSPAPESSMHEQNETPEQESAESTDSAMTEGETMVKGEETMMADSYTLDQVAEHDNKSDCWLAIDGKVYDVTPFIESGLHPGGEQILLGCGKDATDLYNDRPNGSGSHSNRARGMLDNYEVGTLSN